MSYDQMCACGYK